MNHVPASISFLIISIPNQSSKRKGQEDNKDPEPRGVTSNTTAAVARPLVQSLTTHACRVGDLAVWGPLVPIVRVGALNTCFCCVETQRCSAVDEDAVTITVANVVEFARKSVISSAQANTVNITQECIPFKVRCHTLAVLHVDL